MTLVTDVDFDQRTDREVAESLDTRIGSVQCERKRRGIQERHCTRANFSRSRGQRRALAKLAPSPPRLELDRLQNEIGWTNLEVCAAAGVCPSRLSKLRTGKLSPLRADGQTRRTAQLIADFHGVSVSSIWPEVCRSPRTCEPLDESSLVDPRPPVSEALAIRQRSVALDLAMATLTYIERQVMRRLYFQEIPTMAAVARDLGLSAGQVSERHAGAIRKMRGRIARAYKYLREQSTP